LIFSLFENINKKVTYTLVILLTLILFVICAFRGPDVDRDYNTYITAFNGDNLSVAIFEPTFVLISQVINFFFRGNVIFLFIFYALIGVVIKIYALTKLSTNIFVSILIYISYYFSLHEMTQIRIGAACTFFLLALPHLISRNKLYFFGLIAISICFHFSALVLIPLWFLDTRKLVKIKWLIFIFGSVIGGIFLKSLITFIFENGTFGPFQQKILAYEFANNSELNVFNIWMITKLIIAFYLVIYSQKFKYINSNSIIFIKIYILSLCAYFLLSFNPAFAVRINDIFGMSEIILFPIIVFIFKPKLIGKIIIYFIASTYIYLNLFYLKILD
jgi:hypothetical protein